MELCVPVEKGARPECGEFDGGMCKWERLCESIVERNGEGERHCKRLRER